MARMKMKRVFDTTMKEAFDEFILDKTAEGIKSKTLQSYKNQFHALGKWLDTDKPIEELTDKDLKLMIAQMRETTLASNTIASYVRSLKSFLSWCNANDKTQVNIKLYKAEETVKETYTDKELKLLLQKPKIKTCGFTEYRNWVIINLLLNCGCRAATLRSFLIKDVNLDNHTFAERYLQNGGNSLYLQKLLGHSTLAMTKHYCNIYDVDLVKTFDTFSPLATIK